ncbi:unnamed protein product [Polarella glacialis]|uniref:protein-tyrosine-phosphatase n=1 Tax=Polarella glacialis TaxID=89957 RepID=A0A813LDT3_POLGL|nr:unnamed protein product [Polarella glacialis]
MGRTSMEMSEILPGRLYLGSMHVARDCELLGRVGVTHVVDASNQVSARKFTVSSSGRPIVYLDVDEEDSDDTDLQKHFESVCSFVERAWQEEAGRVLIHCVAGVSRSATLAMYCVMRLEGVSLRAAHDLVRRQRPLVRPSAAFAQQLVAAERELRGDNSCGLEDMQLRRSMDQFASSSGSKEKKSRPAAALEGLAGNSTGCCLL